MKTIPLSGLYSPTTGKEFRPELAELEKSTSPALIAGLQERDPGLTRIVGIIRTPLITAAGTEYVGVALVDTSDYDGAEWREWRPISHNDESRGEARLQAQAREAEAMRQRRETAAEGVQAMLTRILPCVPFDHRDAFRAEFERKWSYPPAAHRVRGIKIAGHCAVDTPGGWRWLPVINQATPSGMGSAEEITDRDGNFLREIGWLCD